VCGAGRTVRARGGEHGERGAGGDPSLLTEPPLSSRERFRVQDGPGMGFWRGEDGEVSGLKVRVGRRR